VRQTAHLLVLTRRSEYHLLGERCVGVRDRKNGDWLTTHGAIGARLRGSKPRADASESQLWPGAVRAGVCLVLQNEPLDASERPEEVHCTSPVLAVERPGDAESRRMLEGLDVCLDSGAEGSAAGQSGGGGTSLLEWLKVRAKLPAR
jgi:hypothetical protein